MNLVKEAEIHLTDLAFVRFCEEKYGVNRGVYNTIDAWFYEKGVTHIVHRREAVMAFLNEVSLQLYETNRSGKVSFGHGGLTHRLENFWMHQSNHK